MARIRSVMMSELSWLEYQRRLEAGAIVLLPVGAVEQHGTHMPLGTDWMLATYMARRAAENVDGVVAAPIAYGYRSQIRTGGGPHRCGTTNLDGQTIIALVAEDVLERNLPVTEHARSPSSMVTTKTDSTSTRRAFVAMRELECAGIRDVRILKMIYAERIKPETIEKIYAGRTFPGLDLDMQACRAHGG